MFLLVVVAQPAAVAMSNGIARPNMWYELPFVF